MNFFELYKHTNVLVTRVQFEILFNLYGFDSIRIYSWKEYPHQQSNVIYIIVDIKSKNKWRSNRKKLADHIRRLSHGGVRIKLRSSRGCKKHIII